MVTKEPDAQGKGKGKARDESADEVATVDADAGEPRDRGRDGGHAKKGVDLASIRAEHARQKTGAR